ncbi:MAG: hypothetical protein IT484_06490 [Gammaproteobacteria bacterium]|nr:hypothetical protein [Gammaproteobacteria bacterium]
MDTRNWLFTLTGERLSAALLAVAATVMVLAAINAGFTPHAAHLAGQVLGGSPLGL